MRVDTHVHVFPQDVTANRQRYAGRDRAFRTLYENPRAKTATVEDIVAAMDRSGIDVSVLVNIGWSDHGLCRETNDYLLEGAARYPGRLAVFCGVNPSAKEEAAREIQRCGALGARGVGELHPDYQGYSLDDTAILSPVMEAAAGMGMVLLVHASEPVGHDYAGKGSVTPDVLYRFLVAFPAAPVVLAHWGGGLPFYALMPEVRRVLGHAFFDSAASPFLYESSVFERVVSLVGAEKVLFATDFPLVTQDRLLRQVEEARLSPQARDLVLGGNAAALLGLGVPEGS